MFLQLLFFFSKKNKKKTRALAWVKISEVVPQSPHYLSFLLGGKPLYLKPYVSDAPQNCPILQNFMYILPKFCTSISVWDSRQRTHPKIHEKHEFLAFPHLKSHEFLRSLNYSQLETREPSKINTERHKF